MSTFTANVLYITRTNRLATLSSKYDYTLYFVACRYEKTIPHCVLVADVCVLWNIIRRTAWSFYRPFDVEFHQFRNGVLLRRDTSYNKHNINRRRWILDWIQRLWILIYLVRIDIADAVETFRVVLNCFCNFLFKVYFSVCALIFAIVSVWNCRF